MQTDLFVSSSEANAGESIRPLEGWMQEALKDYPKSDCEALAQIQNPQVRRECFLHVMDYRRRGAAIVAAMAEETKTAAAFGRSGIGGIRLAGAIWNHREGFEIGNEAACFYVLPLSILHPELSPLLVCEGVHAQALRGAKWKP